LSEGVPELKGEVGAGIVDGHRRAGTLASSLLERDESRRSAGLPFSRTGARSAGTVRWRAFVPRPAAACHPAPLIALLDLLGGSSYAEGEQMEPLFLIYLSALSWRVPVWLSEALNLKVT
jgi:hypothetical protein